MLFSTAVMAAEATSRRAVRFGVFEADLESGELRKQGRRLSLQEQPFRVLTLLLNRPGQVVTRDEIRAALWAADTFVDFDHGLNKAMNRLRDSLGDSADSPRFIETIPKRGYRFVAPVEVLQTGSSPRPLAPNPSTHHSLPSFDQRGGLKPGSPWPLVWSSPLVWRRCCTSGWLQR